MYLDWYWRTSFNCDAYIWSNQFMNFGMKSKSNQIELNRTEKKITMTSFGGLARRLIYDVKFFCFKWNGKFWGKNLFPSNIWNRNCFSFLRTNPTTIWFVRYTNTNDFEFVTVKSFWNQNIRNEFDYEITSYTLQEHARISRLCQSVKVSRENKNSCWLNTIDRFKHIWEGLRVPYWAA